MKYISGNIVLIMALIVLAICSIFFTSMYDKFKQHKELKNNDNLALKENPQKDKEIYLINNQVENYQYYNDLSIIGKDEIINPFALKFKTINPITTNKNTTPETINKKELAQISKIIKFYTPTNQNDLNIFIENNLKSDLYLFIYLNKSYRDISINNKLIYVAYIAKKDNFTFKNLPSGDYTLKWININKNKAYRTNKFSIYRDNKYAFDYKLNFTEDGSNKFASLDRLDDLEKILNTYTPKP